MAFQILTVLTTSPHIVRLVKARLILELPHNEALLVVQFRHE